MVRLINRTRKGNGVPELPVNEALMNAAQRILTPAAHWRATGERMSMGASGADPYKWAAAALIQILKKEEYMGWTVRSKTATESCKSKKRESTPQENRLVFLLYIKKMPLGKHCGARVLDTHRPVKLWIVTFQVISPRKKRPLFSMAGIVQSDIKAFAPILVQF